MFYLLQLLLNNFIFAIASIAFQKPARGASGIKAYCPSLNILHRLMTEYCIISHSFSPESRLCTYHILLPPAKPMHSDDIFQHLMHEMLAHLRASSQIAKPRTACDVRTVNCEPDPAPGCRGYVADISRQGGSSSGQLWSGL